MHIGKWSLQESEDESRKWTLPSSVRAVKHDEWEMRKILKCIGVMTDSRQGCSIVNKNISGFHYERRCWDENDFHDTDPDAFLKIRPDGVSFNANEKICAFLKLTRLMDSRDGASDQPDWYTRADWSLDWAQDKDQKGTPDTLATSNSYGVYQKERAQIEQQRAKELSASADALCSYCCSAFGALLLGLPVHS